MSLERALRLGTRALQAERAPLFRAARSADKVLAAAESETALASGSFEFATGGLRALGSSVWPILATELILWGATYALDHSCEGKWFDERKKLLTENYPRGGAVSYSFRVNTGPKAVDNFIEQVVLARLGSDDTPLKFFPLMQDRRPLVFDETLPKAK